MADVDMQRLADELAEIRKTVTDTITNDKVKERAFDQLYAELKQYKDDFLFKAEKPLLLDLLLFYDSLNWFQESLVKQEMSPDVIADFFQYLIDEFLEVLYRRDVMPIEESDTFDRKVHKAVKVTKTDDEGRDYKIAQVLKRGFHRAEKLLRPEEVVIHRLAESNDET
ncbi:MAG: nucleotide exchange factor GrpE [Deltaproteobacteria bacterium]|nr:nucleotide exchange factor GrpE [Deltaproteobacteria bacterium]